MKIFKRFMALMLVVGMMIGVMPTSVFAAEGGETSAADAGSDEFYRILHLDCGRKYFTKDWIIALINEMAAVGYNQLQLAFGNDGMRFLLDDMSVTVGDKTYSSKMVTAGIQAGNKAYYNAGDKNELTQAEMDDIIAHAKSKGIEIVPHVNMPGHMDAILDAIEYVGIQNAHFTGSTTSTRSLNLNNDTAVSFAKALLEKYVAYFAVRGCNYFHIGADEFANDAYGTAMGFPSMGSELYAKFAAYVNDCAGIVKDAGMTPRAWNDGISYTGYSDAFDTGIQITYWSSGWGGYDVASASTLSNKGHKMINTNGDYYFILTGNGITNPGDKALKFKNSVFMGSEISDPVGSMFCIWCDVPGSATEAEVAAAARITLRKMAAAMQNTTAYSQDIVSGGFNADGTIAETREWKTVEHDSSDVAVSGYELTGVTVNEATATIEGAANVKAWDITPNVNGNPYTERGTVKLPVPGGWNTARLTGFYVENDKAVLVKGSYADGYYTFDMPHFSVAGIAELADDDVELIELNVGESKTVLIEGVDLSGKTYEPYPEGIATVTPAYKDGSGESELVLVKSRYDIVSGEKYVLVNKESGNVLTDRVYSTSWGWATTTYLEQKEEAPSASSTAWTITQSGNNYQIKNSADKYITIGNGTANLTNSQTNLTVSGNSDGTFRIALTEDSGWWSSTYYLNNLQNGKYAGGSTRGSGDGVRWYLYQVVESTSGGDTEVTFTGMAPGETYVTINGTVYKIVVHGTVNITINYVDQNGKAVKTETVSVMDNATSYTVSNFNYNGKYCVVEKNTLDIDLANEKNYTVKVTATEEDLTNVTPLTVEYWLTNAKVVDGVGSKTFSRLISAENAYGESGVEVSAFIPTAAYKHDANRVNDPTLSYWRARLLLRSTNEQTENNSDNECQNGVGFTKIRYWNGNWSVYTENDEWFTVDLNEYQFALYFMNDMHLADEISVGTSDWGKKGDGTLENASLAPENVSVAFQVIYEDGTPVPATTTAADLDSYTYLVNYWKNRDVGIIALKQIGDYQIWKVTAETGTHTVVGTGAGTSSYVTDFKWNGNEMTVWEGAPVSQYTISEAAGNINDNLKWKKANQSILVRIYVKAVETEDSLTVVYYDEKFNDTLYSYNISVPAGNNFNNSIVNNKGEIQKPGAFDSDSTRVDVSGYGIENALNKTQYFQTDLTQVPQAVGKYNNGLYTYAGSEIKDDGKTLYLYYTINTGTLSPNFVADFGLPLTFPLSQVVGEGQEELVESVTVTPGTKYGTLTYNAASNEFTYTPTSILTSIDVLTMDIKFTTNDSADTVNVGVTPATTVYYEESFLTYDGGWGTIPNKPTTPQSPDVLGESSYLYGYDPVYADDAAGSSNTVATSNTAGASAQFSFTGTGFQLYGNSDANSGFVTVYSEGGLSKLYMIDTKLSAGDTDATKQQSDGTYYSLPIISETDLPHGAYTVYIKQTNGDNPIHIDGVRIINTIDESGVDSGDSVYFGDKEDKPEFYELRDHVLNAIGVESLGQSDYIADPNNDRDSRVKAITDMAGQVYHAKNGATAIIFDESVTYGEDNAQDLLDNGPKNELYLYPNQTLAFKVTTDRVMQLGLKAPKGSAQFKLNGTETELKTTVDMFYKVAEKATDSTKGRTVTVTVENTGDKVLSVTNLKICDDPNAAFTPLTQEDMENVLLGVYGLSPVTYADAALTVDLVDYAGRKLGSFDLTANGVEGETAVFTAGEIAAAAQAALPGKYALADESAITDVEVVYGESQESRVRIGKVATLNITFVDRRGRKLDSAAITAVQTSGGRCRIPASEIKSLAPKGTRTSWYAPVTMQFGRTNHIVVPVK